MWKVDASSALGTKVARQSDFNNEMDSKAGGLAELMDFLSSNQARLR